MADRLLPPLAAIRVFEAAARLKSFTKAAQELGMTQAAVSYQIKVLEERVGAPLFLRGPRQVALTEVGARLAPAVTAAFEQLAEAYAAARGASDGVLRVTTVLTFASHWLARRLGAFQMAHPGIAVRLDTSSRLLDFARDEVDVAIRTGEGDWPGLEAHFLMPVEYSPMLSPKLAERAGGIREPADLLKLPLLDPRDPWWREWFALAGVDADELAGRPDTSLGSQAHEAAAAMAGQGVAILTPAFFAEELAEGRLVQPFELRGSNPCGYWLAYPKARRNAPAIRAFRDWLLPQFAGAKG